MLIFVKNISNDKLLLNIKNNNLHEKSVPLLILTGRVKVKDHFLHSHFFFLGFHGHPLLEPVKEELLPKIISIRTIGLSIELFLSQPLLKIC
jgi:hypothetical protein